MVAMTKGNPVPFTVRLARWRSWIQALFALAWLSPFWLRLHSVCGPVFHCYSCPLATFACPIGVMANFSAVHVFPMLAVGTVLLVGALVGSFVCGWVCPFGFLQDLIARIPTHKFELPSWMGYTRYAVLGGLVLAIPYFFGEGHPLFFCRLCPAGALEAAVPRSVQQAASGQIDLLGWSQILPSWPKMLILNGLLVLMLFTWRPWCTLFCPLGAIYSLCNRGSVFFLRFHAEQCNDCDLCRRLCRYRGRGERRGGEMRCIRCLDCTRCDAMTVSSVFARSGRLEAKPELIGITPPGGGSGKAE
jgi:ferredoxin-type protein NapH